MPNAAEIMPLVRHFQDRNNQWIIGQALDEGIFNHLPETLGKCKERSRVKRLIPKKYDAVL